MGWEEIKAPVQAIEGFISDAEAECLYTLAKNCDGNIVEIGSWKGKSTVCLAFGSKAGKKGKVFAIDPHHETTDRYGIEDTEPIFRENIKRAQVDDIVIPQVMSSEEAAKIWKGKPISLLFIDGAHNYESVKKDFTLWVAYLKDDAFIAFHDALHSLYPGVRRVIRECIFNSSKFSKIGFCTGLYGGIIYGKKVKSISFIERLRKAEKLLIWYLFPLTYSPPSLSHFIITFLTKVRLLKLFREIKNKIFDFLRKYRGIT